MDAQNTQIIQEKRKRGSVSVPCPHCGADSHVIQTRRNSPGVPVRYREKYAEDIIWRDRECYKQQHRFWTYELIVPDD